jgi:hypothetical protein
MSPGAEAPRPTPFTNTGRGSCADESFDAAAPRVNYRPRMKTFFVVAAGVVAVANDSPA